MTHARYGRYEALHRIASGGMASVYLGRALGAGGFERLVAIKVMHEHIAEEPAFSGMFLDEARLAARIRHPNVVPTLDVADDGRFIVMEYVEGASLQAILEQRHARGNGALPVPIALRIFLDALAGLHAAHELCDGDGKPLRLVHRDVSPHNVLVGVDGLSRITDFGIAFAEARITSTQSGQLKGKLPYMAPEQLEDNKVTRRTDVYSAGCVLFEILAGRRLFQGGNEAAVACAVLAGPDVRVADLRPDIPPPLDRACMFALGRHDDRYPSADAFAQALEDAADEAGITIAKHREIGVVAQLPQMTFPPASTLTGDHEIDPRPAALALAAAATTLALEEEPPTRRTSSNVTSVSERPAPDGAAIEEPAPRPSGITEVAVTSPTPAPGRGRASYVAAALVALGVGAGVGLLKLRDDHPREPAQETPAKEDAPASSATATPSASVTPPVESLASAPVPQPAPTPSEAKRPPPGAKALPTAVPSASPVRPPAPAGSEYHPDNP